MRVLVFFCESVWICCARMLFMQSGVVTMLVVSAEIHYTSQGIVAGGLFACHLKKHSEDFLQYRGFSDFTRDFILSVRDLGKRKPKPSC